MTQLAATSASDMVPRGPEPAILKRLRRAAQRDRLIADITAMPVPNQTVVVTNRLAQTTVRYLTSIDQVTGQRLAEELRSIASSSEYDMLMEDRTYTFFHVIQFLYEYAKHYAAVADRRYFCFGMGRGGGGIEVAPDIEVVSLLALIMSALPSDSDSRNLNLVMEQLGPTILGSVLTPSLFEIQVSAMSDIGLRLSLRYADRRQLEARLRDYGLDGDAGQLFVNTAMHVQGLVQLALDTFVHHASESIRTTGLIQDLTGDESAQIESTCTCNWQIEWGRDVVLQRVGEPQKILQLGDVIFQALHRKDLQYYHERIKTLEMQVQELSQDGRFHELIGRSARMQQLYQLINQLASSDQTVLIRGESGTGKELTARALHESSPRRDLPFVAVNCAAFSETLLESELFGHEKGAFTGAIQTKPGRFERADGGTLFLDEVGDIPLICQIKLLRVIEDQTFERVGGTETIRVDVRIVGATNRNLEELMASGQFREDFYFRLHVLPIEVAPLREHAEDIPELAQHFLEQIARRSKSNVTGLSRGAIEKLVSYPWPGNIRELRNVIERAVAVYARESALSESDISRSLGMHERAAPVTVTLNLRQRRQVEFMNGFPSGSTIEDILQRLIDTRTPGSSRRSLQNDLRKLSDMGYIVWLKDGSSRTYTTTELGRQLSRP
jgi:DNA-binding NtrC family response regulator